MYVDGIDKWGLLNFKTNQGMEFNELEAEPIAWEQGERFIHVKENADEVESNGIYVW